MTLHQEYSLWINKTFRIFKFCDMVDGGVNGRSFTEWEASV